MSELDTPTDLRYTAEHEWVKRTGPTSVRVGITDFAQSQLGDVVFVQLPAVDEDVTAGESLGEVESTKSVSDIFAPFTAKVLAANGELDGQPDLVNTDPYDTVGWSNSRLPTRPHSTPHSRQLWTRRHTRTHVRVENLRVDRPTRVVSRPVSLHTAVCAGYGR